jgi:predicted permease
MSPRIRSRVIATCLTAGLLAVPAVAFAQLNPGNTGLDAAAAGSGLTGGCTSAGCVADVVGRVINIVIGFLGIVLLCLFLYAGFLWMTAQGDEKQVAKAKQILLQAVVGYFIIGTAYALTTFVLTNLASVTSSTETAAPAGTGGTGGTGAP